jgi:hypothetical protein
LYLVLAILVVVGGEDAAGVKDRTAPTLTAALLLTLGMAIGIAGAVLVYVTLAGVSRWRLRQLDRAFASPAARRA